MLISLGCTELLSGSVTDLWLYVSPLQQIDSLLNKTDIGDYTVDCVGIKGNASKVFGVFLFFLTITPSIALFDTKDKISNTLHFRRRQ